VGIELEDLALATGDPGPVGGVGAGRRVDERLRVGGGIDGALERSRR
jgi:hypothetical protein